MKWKFLNKIFETKERHSELFSDSKSSRDKDSRDDAVEQQWYERTYSAIDKVLHPEPKTEETKAGDGSNRKGDRRYSLNVSDIIEAQERIEEWMKTHFFTTFQQDLMDRIEERGMSPVEFYKAALIDRKLFSAIKKNVYYSPKKETAVACCLALKLDENETEHLLSKAGYQLTNSKHWDMIVRYCIQHRIYDVDVVNNLLYHFNEKTIGV